MQFKNYNDLLNPTDLQNFQSSLGKPNGFTFNSLINIFEEENLKYEIKSGFNAESKDADIKEFNKIQFKFLDEKKFNKICEEYSLENIFNINKSKNIYTFNILEE